MTTLGVTCQPEQDALPRAPYDPARIVMHDRSVLRPCRVTRRPSLRSQSRYGPGGPGFTKLRSLRVREPMK